MEPDPFLQSLPESVDLPASVFKFHSDPGCYTGRCGVERGGGWLTNLVLRLGRFPPTAEDIPVTVKVDFNGKEWVWERDFDGHITRSRLTFDHGAGCVREQMRWVTLWLVPQVSGSQMLVHIRRISVFGFRCPIFLLPRSATVESEDNTGCFRFDVSADMPGLGRLIRYRGWLAPVHVERCCD